MKRMFINLLVYLLISSYQLKSQTLYSVDKWMEYIEEMASETGLTPFSAFFKVTAAALQDKSLAVIHFSQIV